MNIVIFAGGTGSIALQTGLYSLLDSCLDGINTKVIVNAYDNGLSTGAVRQVMDGRILGPSDVRKNQTTRLRLQQPNSPWLQFLDIRFTEESSAVEDFCYAKIDEHINFGVGEFRKEMLYEAVKEYFKSPVARKIDYNDFSLANIIYAGLARMHGNSLREAARVMARLMGIEDNVLLNDDTSLFLGAITRSGKRVTDEGDIVSWGKEDDPFVDVFFTTPQGEDRDPRLAGDAYAAIVEADLIILSSGTQWSSLIPTYMSRGFQDALMESSAKIVMVMNRQPDHDSPSQTASDIINILVPRFFDPRRLRVVLDPNGHENMRSLNSVALSKVELVHNISTGQPLPDCRIHDPNALALAVAQAYFHEYIGSDYFIFDYDDTLVGRGNVFPLASGDNVNNILSLNKKTNVAICTGNSIKAINLRRSIFDFEAEEPTLDVYADGGVNKYRYITTLSENRDDGIASALVERLNPNVLFEEDVAEEMISRMCAEGIPLSKIENRGNAIIAIKPIDSEYRNIVANLIKHLFRGYRGVQVKTTGRTTIEIQRVGLTKMDTIHHILKKENPNQITYVGDELRRGNDSVVREASLSNVRCLEVRDPSQTAFFLRTILRTLNAK